MDRAVKCVCLALPLLGSGLQPARTVTLTDQHAERPKENNCGSGKLLPSVYVLGAKNSATSSFYSNLKRATGVLAAPEDTQKEWQFFQTMSKRVPPEEQYDTWLSAFPACPKYRALMGDFSVTNLYTTPFPKHLRWAPDVGYDTKGNTRSRLWDTPREIKDFHARAGGRPPKLAVLLRDPLVRLHSEYYHTLERHNCLGCMVGDNFLDSFAANVRFMVSTPMQVSDWTWKSFYARQIEEYLKVFDAGQLSVIPFRQYVDSNRSDFGAVVLGHLGLKGRPWSKPSERNEHEARPPLDEELPPSTSSRLAFEALMAPEMDRLVQVLARADLGGAWLAGYEGARGYKVEIRKWLEGSW